MYTRMPTSLTHTAERPHRPIEATLLDPDRCHLDPQAHAGGAMRSVLSMQLYAAPNI
jgi:hypothetical protein